MNKIIDGKKILIIHFRVGKTDGVSIEIASWKEIFEKKGTEVFLCSGPESKNCDFVIADMEQQLNPDIFTIDEDAFGGLKTYKTDAELIKSILKKQKKLAREFGKVIDKTNPDYIIVANIFSVGENVACAGALTQVLDKVKTPTIVISHDFYWEEERYNTPTNDFIKEQLDQYFPPKRDYMKYFVINKIAQIELLIKRGINSKVLNDCQDFDKPKWEKSEHAEELLDEIGLKKNDIVVLQATRIVRRKNIELAIDLVSNLNKNANKLSNRPLYNGKVFDPQKNKIVLLLSGYVEYRDRNYLKQLLRYASEKRVKMMVLRNLVNSEKRKKNGLHALWGVYPFADIISYPSEYEGFGNQFLEAVFAKKPVVLFEYPVFLTDIKPKGFKIISLGRRLGIKDDGLVEIPQKKLNKAADDVVEILTNKKRYENLVEKNYKLGKMHFSYQNAWKVFRKTFNSLTKES